MTLHQGYNIVTEQVVETDNELMALDFFRRLAANESVSTPVTVRGLEDVLFLAVKEQRGEVLRVLRTTLRNTGSIGTMDAVQFLIDGKIVDDVEFRVRLETSSGGVYLDIGQLFVEEPKVLTSTQAVARK